jgi:hypothetical protein
MGDVETKVVLDVDAGPDAEEEELAELALGLRADLLDVDLESVRLAGGGEQPACARIVRNS